MGVQWVLVLHRLATLVVVVSFLCGQWPIFHCTPITSIHHFLTVGAYDCFLRCVGVLFGIRGTNAILEVERFCCDRPNPILQKTEEDEDDRIARPNPKELLGLLIKVCNLGVNIGIVAAAGGCSIVLAGGGICVDGHVAW